MLLVKTRIGPSTIHGTGLFANEFIAKGTIIWEFTAGFDVYVKAADIHRLPAAAQVQMLKYCYLDRETGHYILCADDTRFFNHSDAPNAVDLPGPEGHTIAARDIRMGEELTCDYRTFDADVLEKLRDRRPDQR